MGLERPGQLAEALASGNDPRLRQVAEILQRVRPDIVLLNEFDYDPEINAAALLNQNYLGRSQHEQKPILYSYHYRAPVNTGMDSGSDLDRDGETGGPGDAWGFGRFPGQYGMLILSRFPIDTIRTRTFRNLRWSSLPGARRPMNPDGSPFLPDDEWSKVRLSSKNHVDLVIEVDDGDLHFLAHHPTPPVFDGPEDRNGNRNYDEIRFWFDYTNPGGVGYIVDDEGVAGGLEPGDSFVIAGDFNADPWDGDSVSNAMNQLLQAPWINSDCEPLSLGGEEASRLQGGVNASHVGNPAADTADFNDEFTGNLRLDYLLPSVDLEVQGCGVFWPRAADETHSLIEASDHRLVWLDIEK